MQSLTADNRIICLPPLSEACERDLSSSLIALRLKGSISLMPISISLAVLAHCSCKSQWMTQLFTTFLFPLFFLFSKLISDWANLEASPLFQFPVSWLQMLHFPHAAPDVG